MATTGPSLLTGLTGDATSRKRKQSRGEQDAISPSRRGPKMACQESGSSSSMLSSLTGSSQQEALALRRLYPLEGEASARCTTTDDDRSCSPSQGRELHSSTRVDTCQQAGPEQRSSPARPGASPSREGRVFDQYGPFGAETAREAGSLKEDGLQGFTAAWKRNKQGLRPGGALERGSESAGVSCGTSGITKQRDSRSGGGGSIQGQPGQGWRLSLSQDRNNSDSVNRSGSGSGVTREEVLGRGSLEGDAEGAEGDDDGDDDADAQSSGERRGESPENDIASVPRLEGVAAPLEAPLPLASAIPGLGEKRGRREFEEGQERGLKCVRLEGSRSVAFRMQDLGTNTSISPDSVLAFSQELKGSSHSPPGFRQAGARSSSPCGVGNARTEREARGTESPEPPSVGVRTSPSLPHIPLMSTPRREEAPTSSSVRHDGGVVGSQPLVVEERTSPLPGPDQHTMIREALSDADNGEVESSGVMSGYDPDTSCSDAPDGDGSMFVLSSGRSRRKQGGPRQTTRQPTIDDEFEQYFAQMLL